MRGWFLKYRIEKMDGSKIDPAADYFVLRLDKDPAAQKAALAYAEAIESQNSQLAYDLRERVNNYIK